MENVNDIRAHRYSMDQLTLACLDAFDDMDPGAYGECLTFAWRDSSVHAVYQMHKANGAMTFDITRHIAEAA